MVVLSAFTRRSLEATSTAEDGDRGTNATKPLRGTSGGAYWAATRCAATRGAAYFGTGKDVYRATFKEIDGASGDASFVPGKDGVSLPAEALEPLHVSPILGFVHREEVQSVACWDGGGGSTFVASADAAGSLCVCEFRSGGGEDPTSCPEWSYHVKAPSATTMELGWAGECPPTHPRPPPPPLLRRRKNAHASLTRRSSLLFADLSRRPSAGVSLGERQPTRAAVARHFAKDLSVFDGDVVVRTVRTIQNPTAIELLAEDGTYAVAEKSKICVYDFRQGEAGGLAHCLPVNEMVTCLAKSNNSGQPLVASGIGRTVALWDLRKWGSERRTTEHARIRGLRSDVCGIEFLEPCSGETKVCAAGISGEARVTEPGKKKEALDLKGDSRWIGFASDGGGRCVGVAATGGLYSFTVSP